MHISPGAAQNIAFTQQGCDVTGHVSQPERLPTQQQMSDARMRRQFGHGFTVGSELAVAQRAQPLKQLLGLCITGSGRHIEPHQFMRGHAPARQLQRQPGQIGL